MASTYLAQAGSPSGGQPALSTWGEAIVDSLNEVWFEFVSFIPAVIVALIVFIIGWALSVAIGRVVEKILVALRINQAFENIKGLQDAAGRAGLKINIPYVIGEIVKWFFVIVTLLAATNVLQLTEVAEFLREVLNYIPNVVVAAFILVIGVVVANFAYKTVLASVNAAGFSSGSAIAAISKWAIIIFAFMAVLSQLKVAVGLIQTISWAFFAMLALAGGLAFGLGGKDVAARWLKKLESDVTDRE